MFDYLERLSRNELVGFKTRTGLLDKLGVMVNVGTPLGALSHLT